MSAVSSVQVGVAGSTAWIRVDGRGSFQNSGGLKDFAGEMIKRGHREFIVDLKDCELMDSTFMGTLAGIALKLGDGGQLKIIRANPRNREVMQNLGLDRILTVAENESAGSPTAPLHDAPSPSAPATQRDTILEAHQNLITANPDNAVLFKDVIEFLQQKETEPQPRP